MYCLGKVIMIWNVYSHVLSEITTNTTMLSENHHCVSRLGCIRPKTVWSLSEGWIENPALEQGSECPRSETTRPTVPLKLFLKIVNRVCYGFWNSLGRKEIFCQICVQPRTGVLKEGIWVDSDNMHKKILVWDIRDHPLLLEYRIFTCTSVKNT